MKTQNAGRVKSGDISDTEVHEHSKLSQELQDHSACKRQRLDADNAAHELSHKSSGNIRFGSGVELPGSALYCIMEHMVDLEPGGIRGPTYVAQNIANAALVCKEFHHAAQHGFAALAGLLIDSKYLDRQNPTVQQLQQHRVPGSLGWHFWDQLLSDPSACNLRDLVLVAAQLNIPKPYPKRIQETKAEVALRVLDAVQLKAPCPVPAVVQVACLHEKGIRQRFEQNGLRLAWDGDDRCRQLIACLKDLGNIGASTYCGALPAMAREYAFHRYAMDWDSAGGFPPYHDVSLAAIRAEIRSVGITSLQQLLQQPAVERQRIKEAKAAKAAAKKAAHEQRMAAEQAAAQVRRNQEKVSKQVGLVHNIISRGQVMCKCGLAAAKWCVRGCCADCCRAAVHGNANESSKWCFRHQC